MHLQILDHIKEGTAICYLCKTNLYDFAKGLPDDFEDYFVQRGIVSNRYLDKIWDTIANIRHVPTIVLTNRNFEQTIKESDKYVILQKFKIIDGLQRSKRLKIIADTIDLIESNKSIIQNSVTSAKIAVTLLNEISEISSSVKTFVNILDYARSGKDPKNAMMRNEIWLELWVGLSDSDEITKMLVLNAGHKAVSIKHQIELLFLSNLPKFENSMPGIIITREKQISSISYSKNRLPGQFHFPHLISAFESLAEGRAILTNSDFSAQRTFAEMDDESVVDDVNDDLIISYGEALRKLDANFRSNEMEVQWLAREVVLVGIFGAIGAYSKLHGKPRTAALDEFNLRSEQFHKIANLDAFEKCRNQLQLSKVNIGAVNRRAVYNATLNFMSNPTIPQFDWQIYFDGSRS